jgi:hypothetical protein
MKPLAQRNQAVGDSLHRKDAVRPHVARLLSAGFPATVSWLVPFRVVDSSAGKTSRSFAHRRHEGLKGFSPLLTHADSTAAVVVETGIAFIRAPLNQAKPNLVRSTDASAVCHAMKRHRVQEQTPARARRRNLASQARNPNEADVATIALAEDATAIRFALRLGRALAKNLEPSKAESDERDSGRHNGVRASLSLAASVWPQPDVRCDSAESERSVNA